VCVCVWPGVPYVMGTKCPQKDFFFLKDSDNETEKPFTLLNL